MTVNYDKHRYSHVCSEKKHDYEKWIHLWHLHLSTTLYLCHVPMRQLSTNLVRNRQQNKVIHDSWHLIVLYGLAVVQLCFTLMHTCALMFKGLVFILSRKRNPLHITHTEMKACFTNTSCRHTFIIFPIVDLSRADPYPSSLFRD